VIFGWTPLHFASDKGFLSIVEYLVNQKADVNSKNNDGQTPLHLAIEKDQENIVEYLVELKININSRDKNLKFILFMLLLFIMLL